MNFEQTLAQLIVEDRLSTGLGNTLLWSLDNYLGALAVRRINVRGKTRLKDLTFEQFTTLLKTNVLMIYLPGLGIKRMRELRLAVHRFINEHNLDTHFPFIDEYEPQRRRGQSLMERFGW